MRNCLFFLVTILAFSACKTFKSATDSSRESRVDIDSIGLYKNAKMIASSDIQKACEQMSDLSKKSDISPTLQILSLLKAYTYCDHFEMLDPIQIDLLDKKSWFESAYIEQRLHRAEVSKDPLQLAFAYSEKAKQSTKSSEKVELLQKAYQNAKDTHDQNFADEMQMRIYRSAPRLDPNPPRANWLRVAQDFIISRDFENGRKFYQKIIADESSTPEEVYTSLKQFRNSYKIEQKKEEYLKANSALLKWLIPTKNYLRINESFIAMVRAQWTEGDVREAKKTLSKAEKFLKNHFPLDEVYFIRGKIEDESHQIESAFNYFKKALNESKEKNLLREKIIFAMAWDLRKQKKYEDAAEQFAILQKMTEELFAQFKYTYWEAKSWQQSKQAEVAQVLFKKLTIEDPIGYYGLLSYHELKIPIPPIQHDPLSENNHADHPNSKFQLHIQKQIIIRTLALSEEPEILSKYVSSQISNLKSIDSSSLLFVLTNLANAGLYQPLFSNLGNLDSKTRSEILSLNPELLFPKKYLDLVDSSAARFNIQPEFILSILRQESSFDPLARSPADAFGLMQVIPSVAKLQEKSAGVQLFHHEDLYKPEINIPIGTALLSHLLKKYKGQILLTAAAYNANEKAISNWLKVRLKDDPIEFIEDIPYEETRSYMKLILRNFVFYSRMAHPNQSMMFPEECLSGFNLAKAED